MLYRPDGTVITKNDLRRIRQRLGVTSAIEDGEACVADAALDSNFRSRRCCYCGVTRRLHRTKVRR